MAKIHIMSGMLQGKTFELIEDSNISVGRSLDNQTVTVFGRAAALTGA